MPLDLSISGKAFFSLNAFSYLDLHFHASIVRFFLVFLVSAQKRCTFVGVKEWRVVGICSAWGKANDGLGKRFCLERLEGRRKPRSTTACTFSILLTKKN